MSRARRGFTLLEVLICLVLLAIAGGVAVPAFTRLGAPEPTRPVDAVLQLLRDSHRLAIERGVTVAVILDPTSGRYRVDTTGLNAAMGVLADTVLPLQRGTRLESDSARVRFIFLPSGAAIADSVIVRGDGGKMVVAVSPWNGVARADAR